MKFAKTCRRKTFSQKSKFLIEEKSFAGRGEIKEKFISESPNTI